MLPASGLRFSRTVVVLAGFFAASIAPAGDQQAQLCCKIIKVDAEKGIGLVRNPQSGKVGQFTLKEGDAERFQVGDQFDPVKGTHNLKKVDAFYETSLPEIDDLPKAHIVRVRGHEVAAKAVDSETVYRFHTPRFDRVLSSMRPGDEMSVDEPGGWLFYRVKAYGKIPPAVWSYRIE
jgi:hypothetical protein